MPHASRVGEDGLWGRTFSCLAPPSSDTLINSPRAPLKQMTTKTTDHERYDDDASSGWPIGWEPRCSSSPLIELPGITNTRDGIDAEHDWTDKHYPGSVWKFQRTGTDAQGRQLDEITVITADGTEVTICFDISAWFGKSGTKRRAKTRKSSGNTGGGEAALERLRQDVASGNDKAKKFADFFGNHLRAKEEE